MADYWKSTPKYWCKNCAVYVTDTKLGRANHEATGKHQSAVRRALRNLHRDYEREEREKDKAKREVERLNSLVGGDGGSTPSTSTQSRAPRPPPPPPHQPHAHPRPPPNSASSGGPPREQLEQLAELGVSIPDAFRPDLAMAGDWTVTETRVVAVEDDDGKKVGGQGATRSVGVRKRPRRSGDDDDGGDSDDAYDKGRGSKGGHAEFDKVDLDAAVQGLFKKPRHWGRDARTAGGSRAGGGDDDEGDLDRLLSSALTTPAPKTEGATSDTDKPTVETKQDVKKEGGAATASADSLVDAAPQPPKIKEEAEGGSGLSLEAAPEGMPEAPEEKPRSSDAAIVFKKRKTKTVRQR
ncbi:formin-binding protein [Sporothrix schenckii 1099-18]|uniref:Formin-binding protein n=1 Tax=Sporothrix schenckii 1099-18 TaxID=1397361 RepID=A0A0F2MB34_SPOSC|nr:formin-binding protein [Sporothrix schenckii 1099-18]KJR86908.1 formin-binding protein [Sporothrix schenckii 1099-18]